MLMRSKKILLLVLGVLLISGCKAKFETDMSINNDKSMNLKIIEGFDDELINAMMSMNESSSLEEVDEVKNYSDDEQRNFLKESLMNEDDTLISIEEEGFTLEEYQDDTYMGYIFTKNIENIDNFVGETTDFSLSNYKDFDSKKIFTKDGTIYKGKILFEETESEENAETYGVDFEYVFVLTLPNKAISSNATTVSDDGKTLTWDLTNLNSSNIEFEFEFPTFLTMLKDNMFIVAGIVVAIVLIIVVIITLIIMKSRNGKKNNDNKGLNVQAAVVDTQPEIQPIMPQDPVVGAQPEIQPVMPESPVASVQPEIQPVMPQGPLVSTQPEIQPVMQQDPVVGAQPEIQPVMPQDPVVGAQTEIQPVMPQDPVVGAQPEIQPVMPESPVVSVQPEVQPVMPQTSVASVQPEIQPVIPESPVASTQPKIKPMPQDPVIINDSETQSINNNQVINPQPLFPQDIIPPKDYN